MRTRKILKTLKNHRGKMSVRVNVRMSKIMRTPIKVSVRTYATYANCRTLYLFNQIMYYILICLVPFTFGNFREKSFTKTYHLNYSPLKRSLTIVKNVFILVIRLLINSKSFNLRSCLWQALKNVGRAQIYDINTDK